MDEKQLDSICLFCNKKHSKYYDCMKKNTYKKNFGELDLLINGSIVHYYMNKYKNTKNAFDKYDQLHENHNVSEPYYNLNLLLTIALENKITFDRIIVSRDIIVKNILKIINEAETISTSSDKTIDEVLPETDCVSFIYKFYEEKIIEISICRWVIGNEEHYKVYCGSLPIYEEKEGIIADEFEIHFDWRKVAKILSLDSEEVSKWMNIIKHATFNNLIDWKKSVSESKYYGEYGSYIFEICYVSNPNDNLGEQDYQYLYIKDGKFNNICFGNNGLVINVNYIFHPNSKTYSPISNDEIDSFREILDSAINSGLNKWNENEKYLNRNNNEIRITEKDVLVISSSRACLNRNHIIKTCVGIVEIYNYNGVSEEHRVFLGYCNSCNRYFMFQSDFTELLKIGKLKCTVIFLDVKNANKISDIKLLTESILHKNGYNVNASDGLSEDYRQNLLSKLIDNGDISSINVIDFLEWLINTRKNRTQYAAAVKKWENDVSYVKNKYMSNEDAIKIKSLSVRRKNSGE